MFVKKFFLNFTFLTVRGFETLIVWIRCVFFSIAHVFVCDNFRFKHFVERIEEKIRINDTSSDEDSEY